MSRRLARLGVAPGRKASGALSMLAVRREGRHATPSAVFTTALIVGALAALAFWIWVVFLDTSFAYVEGDVTAWVSLFRHRRFGELYRYAIGAAYLRTNYPPLYLAAVAALAPSEALIPETGRLLSLLGYLLGLALIAHSLRMATGTWITGLRAVALCALALRTTREVSACYPDAMAFGVAVTALYFVTRRTPGWPVLSPIGFALSCFIKHSLIVFPVGVMAWAVLSQHERKRGLAASLLLAFLIAGPLWLFELWEPLIRQSAGRWDPWLFLKSMMFFAAPLSVALFIAASLLKRYGEVPREIQHVLGPWIGVFLCGVPWLLALGRIGSGPNYMHELQAALGVLLAVAWHLGWWPRLLAINVSFVLCEAAIWMLAITLWAVPVQRVAQESARVELQKVAAATAPRAPIVLADPTWLAVRNGFEPLLMPFLVGELNQKKLWDIDPLIEDLRNGKIDLILIGCLDTGPDCRDLRLPLTIWPVVSQRYELVLNTPELRAYRPR